jgi:hypothetical protein
VVDEFRRLWREFVIGTKSLSYHLNKGGKTPFYAKELERFKTKIVDPMDAAWLRMTEQERAQADLELFPASW